MVIGSKSELKPLKLPRKLVRYSRGCEELQSSQGKKYLPCFNLFLLISLISVCLFLFQSVIRSFLMLLANIKIRSIRNPNYKGSYPASRIASLIFPRSVLASSKSTTASLFSRFTSTSTTPCTEAIALPTLTTQWLHSKPSILMISCTREMPPSRLINFWF